MPVLFRIIMQKENDGDEEMSYPAARDQGAELRLGCKDANVREGFYSHSSRVVVCARHVVAERDVTPEFVL